MATSTYCNRYGDPDLGLHRVLAGAVERLDSEVLLNPFEEQLHGPPRFVDLSDHMSRESEVVGEELEPLFRFRIQIGDAAERIRVNRGGFKRRQDDGVIGLHARRLSTGWE